MPKSHPFNRISSLGNMEGFENQINNKSYSTYTYEIWNELVSTFSK